MGAGKTTVGRALAERLKIDFIDLDEVIETKTFMSIPEIFEKHGEHHFRKIESQALKEIAKQGSEVVALGGGTLTRSENLRMVKASGRSIYLRATVDHLAENLKRYHDRPLLSAESTEVDLKRKLEMLLQQRRQSYEACDFSIDVKNGMNVDKIAQDIIELLRTDGSL